MSFWTAEWEEKHRQRYMESFGDLEGFDHDLLEAVWQTEQVMQANGVDPDSATDEEWEYWGSSLEEEAEEGLEGSEFALDEPDYLGPDDDDDGGDDGYW